MKNTILKLSVIAFLLGPWQAFACPLINNQVDWNCDGKLKAVFIGDSITKGGADQGGYVRFLKEVFLQDMITINHGIGGITSDGVLKKFRRRKYRNLHDTDYLFITIGVNDYWERHDTINNIHGIIRAVNSHYRAKKQTSPIIKVNIPARMNLEIATPGQAERRKGQDVWIRRLGRKMLKSNLPIGARFDKVPVIAETFKNDGIHPITNGYQIMSEILFDYIDSQLKSSLYGK